MYSTYNEGKSVVAERFIRILKNKIFKHMVAVLKNVYFDVLDDNFKYNNTVHRTIKMKSIDVTSDSYAEYNKDFNKKDPKFKVCNHLRILKYKNTFAKGYAPNKFLLLVKLKIQLRGYMLLVTWMVTKLLEVFTKKNCKILVKKNLE